MRYGVMDDSDDESSTNRPREDSGDEDVASTGGGQGEAGIRVAAASAGAAAGSAPDAATADPEVIELLSSDDADSIESGRPDGDGAIDLVDSEVIDLIGSSDGVSSSQGRQEATRSDTGAAVGDATNAGGGEEGAFDIVDLQVTGIPSTIAFSGPGRQEFASTGAGYDVANAGGELEGTSLMAAASAPASTASDGYSSVDDEERACEPGVGVFLGTKTNGLDEDQVDEKQGEAKEEAVDEARVPGRRPPSMRPAARAARDKLKKLRFDEGLFNYEAHGSYLSGKARTQLPSRPVESSSSSSESSYGSSPDGKPAPKKAKGAPPARKNAKGAQAARKKVNAVLVTRKKAAVRNQARAPSDRPGASAPAPVPPPTAGAAVQASLARSPAPPSTAEAAALGAASPDASSIGAANSGATGYQGPPHGRPTASSLWSTASSLEPSSGATGNQGSAKEPVRTTSVSSVASSLVATGAANSGVTGDQGPPQQPLPPALRPSTTTHAPMASSIGKANSGATENQGTPQERVPQAPRPSSTTRSPTASSFGTANSGVTGNQGPRHVPSPPLPPFSPNARSPTASSLGTASSRDMVKQGPPQEPSPSAPSLAASLGTADSGATGNQGPPHEPPPVAPPLSASSGSSTVPSTATSCNCLLADEAIAGDQVGGTGFLPFSVDGDSIPGAEQRRLEASLSISSNGCPPSFHGPSNEGCTGAAVLTTGTSVSLDVAVEAPGANAGAILSQPGEVAATSGLEGSAVAPQPVLHAAIPESQGGTDGERADEAATDAVSPVASSAFGNVTLLVQRAVPFLFLDHLRREQEEAEDPNRGDHQDS